MAAPQQAAGTGGIHNPGTPRYAEALTKLQPLRPVLARLNHRNKNQHRGAAWWGAFGLLRRHVDGLAGELDATAALSNTSAKGKCKKRKREDDAREEKARGHVRWLRDVLVPKCYLAFSQLTADNQFATLGVVLLGALAQVHAVCVMLVGEAQGTDEDSLPPASATLDHGTNKEEPSSSSLTSRPSSQGGVVISRDEVAKAEKLRKTPGISQARSLDRSQLGKDDEISVSKQQKASMVSTKKGGPEKEAKPAKKKKAKKGDEFDDLFKGLF
ncbi:hypothetical protein F5B20DRAFT_519445 [Whalleya microplaca]|nr:hypothetical protein F5B20DRAFT_519445 [Whalleya microplaca]